MRRQIDVRARCPRCGPLIIPGELFGCAVDPGRPSRGLCQLECPGCSQTILFPTAEVAIQVLFKAGAQRLAGLVPFELLEEHSGPAISWSDLLDFQLALSRSPWPQTELNA